MSYGIKKAEPLSREIFDKLVLAGFTSLSLKFSGGHDEGELDIDGDGLMTDELESDIYDWAWRAYRNFSGAGIGQDFGDDITYNLKDKTVTFQEWEEVPNIVRGDLKKKKLSLKD